jgi:peptide/nickel transport system substrate-binding protein
MARAAWGRIDQQRRDESTPGSVLLDELVEGSVDRREFLRRGTIIGLSTSAIASGLVALGEAAPAEAAPAAVRVGGRIHVAVIPAPAGALEPHTLVDVGGLEASGITGEFLTRATNTLGLRGELATNWTPNHDATVWTFKLRPNVTFQSGQRFGADDVVATYNRLVDPNSGSQALSAYRGVLSPGGIKKLDDLTVQFHLDAPNAHFPYLTSSTTYQAIILPASYQVGTFTTKPQTTGGFQLTSYTPGVGARYDRFPGWWGGKTPLDGVDVSFYSDPASAVAALLGGQTDLIGQIDVATARPLLRNHNLKIYRARGATHRQVCIRVDEQNPFKDYRVRQAVALSLDRPQIIKTLWAGLADVGNDSPFAPVFPSTDHSVPQRHQDIRTAKQLMAAAGYSKGFDITLTTETVGEVPQLAQIIQRSVRPLGIKMNLNILTVTQYFAGSQTGPPSGWGITPWLNAPINITDWSHRAVPNVYLTSAFKTKGVWNASHYSNKAFDSAANSYIGAIALKDQRRYEKRMQLILLHDTPVIIPYFQNYLQAVSNKVHGYQGDASGHVYLSRTSIA